MRYFHKTNNQFHRPIVNLDKIWTLVGEDVRNKYKNTEKVDKALDKMFKQYPPEAKK